MYVSITSCDKLGAGSYQYAEEYELNYSEDCVKIAIQEFKKEHSEYIVPEVTIDRATFFPLLDHQTEKPDNHWFVVYFYYTNENKILNTWTRPTEQGKTIFAFVGINDGLTVGNWKQINKDLDKHDNNLQKKKFEERILNGIKAKLSTLKSCK
jgi:hypothetical protein